MVRVKNTGFTINGHREDEIKTQLEYYMDHSQTALDLLDAASTKSALASNEIGKIRKQDGNVLLFWRALRRGQDEAHELGIKELSESCLFEIKNLMNSNIFLTAGLGKPVPAYGLARAKVEAESTVMIVKVLNEISARTSPQYVPSAWGTKQIKELGGRTGDLAAVHVAGTPHDSKETNKFLLPSKYLYAYEKMMDRYKYDDMGRTISNIVSITAAPPAAPSLKKYIWTLSGMQKLFRTTFKQYTTNNGQLFIWLIYAIRDIQNTPGWRVDWKGQTTKDYIDFADAVLAVNVVPPILPNTQRVKDIKQGLMKEIINGAM